MLLGSPPPFWTFTFLKVICAFSLEVVGPSLHSRISEIYSYVPWYRRLPIQRDEKSMDHLNLDIHVVLDSGNVLSISFLIIPSSLDLLDWSLIFQFFFLIVSFSFCSALWEISLSLSLQLSIEFNILSISFLIPKNSFLFPIAPFSMYPDFVLWMQYLLLYLKGCLLEVYFSSFFKLLSSLHELYFLLGLFISFPPCLLVFPIVHMGGSSQMSAFLWIPRIWKWVTKTQFGLLTARHCFRWVRKRASHPFH